MNYCKICGQRCGIYEICDKCQVKVDKREIKRCKLCNNYYFADKECTCLSADNKLADDDQNAKNKTVYVEEKTETVYVKEKEGCFGKAFGGTFGFGCGCLTFIIAVIAIAVIFIMSTFK